MERLMTETEVTLEKLPRQGRHGREQAGVGPSVVGVE
jgi:hypothetical protein